VKALARIVDQASIFMDNPTKLDEFLELIEKSLLKPETEYKVMGQNWELFFKSKILGFIQSRMYSGNWNLTDLQQDFEFKFIDSS